MRRALQRSDEPQHHTIIVPDYEKRHEPNVGGRGALAGLALGRVGVGGNRADARLLDVLVGLFHRAAFAGAALAALRHRRGDGVVGKEERGGAR